MIYLSLTKMIEFAVWIVLLNLLAGGVYSQPQCSTDPDPCSTFVDLNEPSRNVNFEFENTGENDFKVEQNWYRFVGDEANDVYDMPTSPVATGQCNAYAPIWLTDAIPSPGDGIRNLAGCASFLHNQCIRTYTVPTKNCVNFRVYCLSPTQDTYDRFCMEWVLRITIPMEETTTASGQVLDDSRTTADTSHTTAEASEEETPRPQDTSHTTAEASEQETPRPQDTSHTTAEANEDETTKPQGSNDQEESLPTQTVIIAASVSVIVLLMAAALIVCLLITARRRKRKEQNVETNTESDAKDLYVVDMDKPQENEPDNGNFDDLASRRSITDPNYYERLQNVPKN